MSWYSIIYTFVREYRFKNPISGWFLTRALNILLIIQLAGLWFSMYVYIFITVGYYVQYPAQATCYLIIAIFLFVMSMWSLSKTSFTNVARVPEKYRPTKELQDRLKAVTPLEKERYMVEKSTAEQTREQNLILEEMCNQCNVKVAECDQVGRIKFCYECGHIKPDRARHCSSCGKCSVKYDHHCPWINKCITQSNYKYFLLYICYTTSYVIWFLLTSLEGLIRYFVIQRWSGDLSKLISYLILYIPGAVFAYYPLGELIIFHWQLISLNETTVEQTKPAVLRYDNMADYNMGRMNNFRQVFGWGLWPFPIESVEHDGLHFDIRYLSAHQCRFVKAVDDESSGGGSSENSAAGT